MVQPQAVKSYHLRFQFKGLPEPLVYRVDQAESERLQHFLQEPEQIHRSRSYFFFTTTEGQKVMVSLRDVQGVTCGWEVEGVGVSEPVRAEADPLLPNIEIYFRETAQPYRELLEDPGPLETIFLVNRFEAEAEPFVFFLDGEGEAVFFRPDQVVLLSYYWVEEKLNLSQLERIKGPSPFADQVRGVWLIQVWQSGHDEQWYADLEFEAEGETELFEVERYGPQPSQREAAEIARQGLESHLKPRDSRLF